MILLVALSTRSLLCPHIPGRFQVESMSIPCGFHGFHMEFVWLRAQPFWCKFPCLFHMETPWNIPLESRWNGMESTTIPSMESIWIPHIPHGFYSIPYGFHIFHMNSIVFHSIPHGFHMD